MEGRAPPRPIIWDDTEVVPPAEIAIAGMAFLFKLRFATADPPRGDP